jgi:hypothetical protein
MSGAWLIRDLHVAASRRACIRHVLGKLAPETRRARTHRKARHKLLRAALRAHEDHYLDLVPRGRDEADRSSGPQGWVRHRDKYEG